MGCAYLDGQLHSSPFYCLKVETQGGEILYFLGETRDLNFHVKSLEFEMLAVNSSFL